VQLYMLHEALPFVLVKKSLGLESMVPTTLQNTFSLTFQNKMKPFP